MQLNTQTLRAQLRRQRRQVPKHPQLQSEYQILQRLIRFSPFQHAKHIGIYLHAFGEIHTSKIIHYCLNHNKHVYLPMICSMNQQLVWVEITRNQYCNQRFFHHPLGMKEPMASRGQHVAHLDLLILPLLACDHFGTRIGMGGGFYDKTLATAPKKPYRLGLAHDFQLINETLKRESWDQPLDALLTPSHLLRFKR